MVLNFNINLDISWPIQNLSLPKLNFLVMKSQISNQFIREIKLLKDNQYDPAEYPYNIKSIKTLSNLILHPKVTFIIGENGSGKSTLLEAVAVAYGFNPEGGSKNFNFETNPSHSILYENIKLIKGVLKPKTGYFFRAESFSM